VLYEEYLRQMTAGDVPRQKLLVPLQLELSPEQLLLLQQLQERFAANGFEMEPFGARAVLVKAIPALASQCEVEQLVFEILERIEDGTTDYSVTDIQERVAAGLACRAAVKINTPLYPEKMDFLLRRLLETENPMSCPHGRPVVLRIHIRDLEKNFQRS
jgi:DNA mismatch repair protein MutL